jgi:predicted phosphodiesterase
MMNTGLNLDQHERMLVIGDVHGRYEPWRAAYDYAVNNKMLLMMLGDLVDVNDGAPKIFEDMVADVTSWALLIGNHENKISRYLAGNPVKLSNGNQVTADQLASVPGFRDNYEEVMTCGGGRVAHFFVTRAFDFNPAGVISQQRNLVFTHGAVHPQAWDQGFSSDSRRQRDTALYGETRGDKYSWRGREFPVRTYDWVDSVPEHSTVFVGHDTRAFLPPPTEEDHGPRGAPYQHTGKLGGQVWFMDTGCGKGGTLSGAVLDATKSQVLDIIDFGA